MGIIILFACLTGFCGLVLGVAFYLNEKTKVGHDTVLGLSVSGAATGVVCLIAFCWLIGSYVYCDGKRQYINKRYDKSYTAEDYFYNTSAIDKEIEALNK